MANQDKVGKRGKNNKGALARLEEALYGKDGAKRAPRRTRLRPRDIEARAQWEREQGAARAPRAGRRKPLATYLLIAAVFFFVMSAGIAFFVFLGGANVISERNIDISVVGPLSVEAGEEYSFQVLVENGNNAALEFADLVVLYPEGTRSAADVTKRLDRARYALGTIEAGGIAGERIRAVLFGQEGEKKTISFELEYRVEGSNAIFVADESHEITISSSPIRTRVETLREVSAGQEFEMVVHIESNTDRIIEDVLVSLDTPFGFSLTTATPQPISGTETWRIGDLAPGVTHTIRIHGTLHGQDGEEKVFRVETGVPSEAMPGSSMVGMPFGVMTEAVRIVRPFLGIQVSINGDTGEELAVLSEQAITARVTWINNTPAKMANVEIIVQFGGNALDKRSVKVNNGFYRSLEDSVVWNSNTLPDLAELEPGERGSASFTFASLPLVGSGGTIIPQPNISFVVDAESKRLAGEALPGMITGAVARTVRIISDVVLSQRAVYHTGPFVNTGPLPPKAEAETSYTIVWTVANASNDVSDGVVTATLPPYVRWMGQTTPASENIRFNNADRSIAWSLGRVDAGAGVTTAPREVAFRVVLTPSVSQIGETLELVREAALSGIDTFADAVVAARASAATTRLTTDPQFRLGDEKVVE